LRHSLAVAQVDEDDAMMIAIGIHPPGKRDGLADVFLAETVAGRGAVHKGRGEYERRAALPVRSRCRFVAWCEKFPTADSPPPTQRGKSRPRCRTIFFPFSAPLPR